MRQRIVVSGRGGQGVLTLTRILAEAASAAGHEVITTETHGMAQRGGAVLSTIKVGAFHGPLVASGEAEVGLFLHVENLPVHSHYLRRDAAVVVNTAHRVAQKSVNADGLASGAGEPRAANLAVLGYAAGKGILFAPAEAFEAAIRQAIPARYLAGSLRAFQAGLEASQ